MVDEDDGAPRPGRASLREVADRAGVAISSASRVLSNHPDVSRRMRQRVLAAVAELGYEPNMLAQSLRRQETLSINTLQRTRQGATLPGSRLGLGLSRVGQSWLPDTVAVRAAADAAEIVIWIGDGPEPPACARVVPVRSGQPPDVIDIDPNCER